MKIDFQKISDIATLLRAGMTIADIKEYAEVIETSPEVKDKEIKSVEDLKEVVDKKSVEDLPKADEKKEDTDPIETLKSLVKE